MVKIIIYGSDMCGYTRKALEILKENKIEHKFNNDYFPDKFNNKYNTEYKTIPIIFVQYNKNEVKTNKYIGGCSELINKIDKIKKFIKNHSSIKS